MENILKLKVLFLKTNTPVLQYSSTPADYYRQSHLSLTWPKEPGFHISINPVYTGSRIACQTFLSSHTAPYFKSKDDRTPSGLFPGTPIVRRIQLRLKRVLKGHIAPHGILHIGNGIVMAEDQALKEKDRETGIFIKKLG